MTYHDEWLKHHGVKGMRWGVRRYKSIRSDAKTFQKQMDKSSSKKYKAERKSEKIKNTVNNTDKKLASAKHYDDIAGSKSSAKKVAKLTNKKAAHMEKLGKAEEKRRLQSTDYNKSRYQYDKRVKEAAKLPIAIKRREKWANAKKNSRNIGATLAQGLIDGQLQQYLGPAASEWVPESFKASGNRTRNDRFAESVQNAQSRKYNDPVGKKRKRG